jgi:hypothetical protein
MIASRRGFLVGLGASLVAAPAIVRASSLMPVRAIKIPTEQEIWLFGEQPGLSPNAVEMTNLIRQTFLPRLAVQLYQELPLLSELERIRADC